MEESRIAQPYALDYEYRRHKNTNNSVLAAYGMINANEAFYHVNVSVSASFVSYSTTSNIHGLRPCLHTKPNVLKIKSSLEDEAIDRKGTSGLNLDEVDKMASYVQNFLLRVNEVVLQHLKNPSFTIEDLADAHNMSVSTLKRILKKASGMSPGKFVREVRLQQARNMLEAQQYATVLEVVYAVGFENASHFSKLYLERFGKRPSEYL